MKSLLKIEGLMSLIDKNLSRHELIIIVGDWIKENHPKPLVSLPEIPKESLIKALIATGTTEEEISKTLRDAGFPLVAISIMPVPIDEKGTEALALCQAMGADLTREGLPCMTMFW